ncbi:MAG: endolytic transglycosylase MltG [Bdellovibrionales bacterium]|nr:endolytic transglycosylase MltG [Bdellovibrionales bacterium]
MRVILLILRLCLILGIPLLIGYGTYRYTYATFFTPIDAQATTPIVVEVTAGSSFKDLCVSLEKNNLVRHWWVLDVISRLRGDNTRIQPGEYLLSQTMTPVELLKTMAAGKLHKRELVLSAGSDDLDVVAAFEHAGLATEADVLEKLRSPELLVRAGIRGDSVLGYLAPGEYEFSKSETLDRMFWELSDVANGFWNDELLAQADRLRMSRHEIVTLASLLEATNAPATVMPTLSSVFHNRLDAVMHLNSEAALRYILKKKNEPLTDEDKGIDSPYNTFTQYGLPPNPINNPSKDAIIAALYPSSTQYYDFTREGDNFSFSEKVEPEPIVATLEETSSGNEQAATDETPAP